MWQALELAQSKNFIEDKEAGLASKWPKEEPTFQVVKDSVWQLRVPWLVSQKSSSLMTPSQPWTIRQIEFYAKKLAEKTKSMTKLIVAQRISNNYGCRFDFGLG